MKPDLLLFLIGETQKEFELILNWWEQTSSKSRAVPLTAKLQTIIQRKNYMCIKVMVLFLLKVKFILAEFLSDD